MTDSKRTALLFAFSILMAVVLGALVGRTKAQDVSWKTDHTEFQLECWNEVTSSVLVSYTSDQPEVFYFYHDVSEPTTVPEVFTTEVGSVELGWIYLSQEATIQPVFSTLDGRTVVLPMPDMNPNFYDCPSVEPTPEPTDAPPIDVLTAITPVSFGCEVWSLNGDTPDPDDGFYVNFC